MKTIILRPSVDSQFDNKIKELEKAFSEMYLIDKTVCEDRIVYIFKEKEILGNFTGGNHA